MDSLSNFWENSVPKGHRHFMYGDRKMIPEVKKRIYSRVKKHILDKLNFDEIDTTMDWGCGGGLFAKEISKYSNLCLMDISKSSLENALNYIGEGKNNPVARIDILPANSPVSDEKGLKHIRFSNGTQLLPEDQEIEYFKKRFPNLDILEKDVNKL